MQNDNQPQGALAIPSECPHLIVFDDIEVEQLIFAGAGAREAALKKWDSISTSWNAHLFVRVARNSRDDGHPCAMIADPACAHEWTDDGEFNLTCTKCGLQENHEPYGWVQTRGPAINQFTQEWDVVQGWEDQDIEYKAMHENADPAEVVRLRLELSNCTQAFHALRAGNETLRAQLETEKKQHSQVLELATRRWGAIAKKDAQLAERDAQAAQHKLAMDAACAEIAEQDALLQKVLGRLKAGKPGEAQVALYNALSASAEPKL